MTFEPVVAVRLAALPVVGGGIRLTTVVVAGFAFCVRLLCTADVFYALAAVEPDPFAASVSVADGVSAVVAVVTVVPAVLP